MMNVRKRLALIAAAMTLGAGLSAAGPAQADQPSASVPSTQSFVQQAKAAHLTGTQASALQSAVNRYLKELGGKQIGPNEIDFGGDGKLFVAIPGEDHPRDFASGAATSAVDDCDFPMYNGNFCAYSKAGYRGDLRQWSACKTYDMPFGRGGSWINNQTKGQVARMYNRNGSLIFTTYSYDSDASGDWYHVWTVKLC
ncbi:hypothetical protein [Streptomyces violaceusniger]|uniref:Secreted protein n=1 Tax=Streptomyces violaceusniger TaxID=68280 RepID=A0A4D4LGM3_STRVO|nr:hypothetical protein SVIO_110850 [Streptomyces violaceusniger]